ncbi:MAG: peptide ABC transporter substrate-binding protein, partial [Lachnospiraceae bacterium]|nr:peptide ABC transporter substrate-binding protein [Lachnospiraceae bacterium]
MKKALALMLCGAMVFSLAACGDSAQSPDAPAPAAEEAPAEAAETAEEAPAEEAAEAPAEAAEAGSGAGINVCLASEPATLDPALNSAVDGATLCAHLFSGLSKWALDENGNLAIVPDAAEELVEGVLNDD